MIKIYFVEREGNIYIEPVDCLESNTFAEIYEYVNSILCAQLGEGFSSALSHDGEIFWPADENPLSCVFQHSEHQVLVQVIAPLIVHAQIDGQFSQKHSIPVNSTLTIENFAVQVLQHVADDSRIEEYQIFDENGQEIIKTPQLDINNTFEAYKVKGSCTLNLIRKIDPEKLNLENMSLILDPKGEYVTYNFLRPLKISGKLRKVLGEPKNRIYKIDIDKLVWTTYKKLRYANPDEYGLVVEWNNDTYSAIQIIK